MIPTLLLVGMVVGGGLGRDRWAPLAIVGAAVSLLWGIVVGVGAGSVATWLGGTAVAAANVAAGAVIGVGVRELLRALVVRDATP